MTEDLLSYVKLIITYLFTPLFPLPELFRTTGFQDTNEGECGDDVDSSNILLSDVVSWY